jgi:transcriptional regulator with XRE-family HTH domain
MSEDEQKKIFARNLNRILSEHNKTQKEVADAIRVSPQTFNTWCQGIALPRMGKVQLLADYFKINKSDLIEPYDSVKPSPSSYLSLDPEETRLINTYRSFNATGKAKLMDYLSDLDSSPRNHGEVLDSFTGLIEKDNLA